MSSVKVQSVDRLVLRALQQGVGTMKVMAALGELLAADAMVNLCSAVGYWSEDSYSDADRARISDLDYQAVVQVNEAWAAFEAAEDRVAASAQLVPVLLSAASTMRELVKDVDFYNDAVIDPRGGVP